MFCKLIHKTCFTVIGVSSTYNAIASELWYINIIQIIYTFEKEKIIIVLKSTFIQWNNIIFYFTPTNYFYKFKNTLDKITPGLCKVEFSGLHFVQKHTLCMEIDDAVKYSYNGVNKSLVKDPQKILFNVLEKRMPEKTVHKGFRSRNNAIFSYEQEKYGFSYFYIKRHIHSDGIATSPLDIVLKPLPSPYENMWVIHMY